MAKKNTDTIRMNWTLEVGADELGLPSITFTTDPSDTGADREQGVAALKDTTQLILDARERVAASNASASALKPGKPLCEAVEEFLAEGVKKPKTFRTYRTALNRQAIPFFGADTLISSIDQERFAQYVKHIFADETRKHSTKDGFVNAFASMFGWLHARYPKSTAVLSTKTLVPQQDEADARQRDAFTLAHLRVLFENAGQHRDRHPHYFWATVATAFMGCRIEELAQVNLEVDLKHDPESGVWYLDLNEQADSDGVKRKSLKRPKTSTRVVPIHSALIRHGFLEYLETQRRKGASRPFEHGWQPWREPAMNGVHWAHYIIRWGSRELVKLDKSGKLNRTGLKLGYFHSMRHTFTNVLGEREVSEERRAALQGQAAAGSGENGRRYLKLRHDPRTLSEIVEAHLGVYAAILDDVMAVV